MTPRGNFSLPDVAGSRVCEECGATFETSGRARFCKPYCRYKHRDRARYERDPEAARARSRAYYAENRELVLEKAAERRRSLPGSPGGLCSECGEAMTGRRNRVVCSKRCADRRYWRLHPEAYKAKQRRKYARRKSKAAEDSPQ